VTIRQLRPDDREALRPLWQAFMDEIDEPAHWRDTWEDAWREIEGYVERDVALVAEEDGELAGYSLARVERPRVGYQSDLYVRPVSRRRSVAKRLLAASTAELAERGAELISLNVDVRNELARTVYRRLGFREESLDLIADVDALEARLAGAAKGASFGSIHVQSDDLAAVERAVRQFVPRLPGGSAGSVISQPQNGWIAVHDELCDREPRMLRRLAREVSDRMGAVVLALGVENGEVVHYDLMERGRVVDEYLSVPEYHGPRPPGEVVALAANPTLLARLTGADPARIRAIARTASSPAELPPAPGLLAELAAALGLSAGEYGYEEARVAQGAVRIEPE
jgi:ribosomal protein S18 acetylase RimI-like enzyme